MHKNVHVNYVAWSFQRKRRSAHTTTQPNHNKHLSKNPPVYSQDEALGNPNHNTQLQIPTTTSLRKFLFCSQDEALGVVRRAEGVAGALEVALSAEQRRSAYLATETEVQPLVFLLSCLLYYCAAAASRLYH